MYKTSTITPELRDKIYNGAEFDKCERCKLNALTCEEKDKWKNIRFYKRYNKVLCDECVDKLDGTWNMEVYVNDNDEIEVNYPLLNKKKIPWKRV